MTFVPTILGSGITAFNYLSRTRETQETLLKQAPDVARDLAGVRERMTKIQTSDELLDDRPVLRVALASLGMEEDIDNTGFIRQVLDSDLNDPRSFANRLADKRYETLARMFNFGGTGGANLPGSGSADTLTPRLQALTSVDDLFTSDNAALLGRALEVFGLEDEKNQTEFLKTVLKSDLGDPNSLANRIGDQKYIDFVAAFTVQSDTLPEIFRGKLSDSAAAKLRSATSGSDITSDSRLMESVLDAFGLQDDAGNPFFIEAVLNSDLSDPKSFANRLSDPRYAQLAEAFDFAGRAADRNSIYGFGAFAATKAASFASIDTFLSDTELVTASLSMFDLQNEQITTDTLRAILQSDFRDDSSFVNQFDDTRYRAFAEAFDFTDPTTTTDGTFPDRVAQLIEAVDARRTPARTSEDFFNDPGLYLSAMNFFDIPLGTEEISFTRRVLDSELTSPTAIVNLTNDPRFKPFAVAVNLGEEETGHVYPLGFEDAVIDNYIARAFEIQVGNFDSSMRLSLGFERDLGDAIEKASSNDGKWFEMMAANPVRAVMEGALGLPASFGQLDIDKQLEVFKERSQQFLGTSTADDLLQPDKIAEIHRRYLASQATAITAANNASFANILLQGSGSSFSLVF